MLRPRHLLRRFRQPTAPRALLEAAVWAAGLIALACTDPAREGLLDLCVFQWIGLERCPGCGLGHAVAFLFRGELAASFQAHPLGGFAVAVLATRIVTLVREAWPTPSHHPTS